MSQADDASDLDDIENAALLAMSNWRRAGTLNVDAVRRIRDSAEAILARHEPKPSPRDDVWLTQGCNSPGPY